MKRNIRMVVLDHEKTHNRNGTNTIWDVHAIYQCTYLQVLHGLPKEEKGEQKMTRKHFLFFHYVGAEFRKTRIKYHTPRIHSTYIQYPTT
jgi:hypothetical protein